MAKYLLESAGNINWMALFAMLTFMFIFITSVVLMFRKNDEHIKHMSNLPLDEENQIHN